MTAHARGTAPVAARYQALAAVRGFARLVPLLLFSVPGPLQAQIPPVVDFGQVAPDRSATRTFVVEAPAGPEPAILSFVSSCDCVRVIPAAATLRPGDRRAFTVSFDSSGFGGAVRKTVVVRSEVPALAGAIAIVAQVLPGTRRRPCPTCEDNEKDTGSTKFLEERAAGSANAAAQSADQQDALSPGALMVELYLDPGCRKCDELVRRELPGLGRRHGRVIAVETRDVLDPAAMAELLDGLAAAGLELEALPVAFSQQRVFQGLEAILTGVDALLQAGKAAAGGRAGARGATREVRGSGIRRGGSGGSISTLAVILAGLADGVNPCAFSTILFLVSMLAVSGRSRSHILATGGVYTAVVYLGYFAVGLGLLSAVRRLLVFPRIAGALRWVLVAALVALAVLSLRDAVTLRRGHGGAVLLQLPRSLKERLRAVVRDRVRTASLLTGTAIIALLVTVFEFSCTGQVYLPVIMHLARTENPGRGWGLLALYNAAFILPLTGVFAVAWAGAAIRPVAAFFASRLALVKAALSVVFLGLAALTVLG